ncbi:MAG: DUF3592 domain-containing protein [Candidatus Korobacteraceae bacterium]
MVTQNNIWLIISIIVLLAFAAVWILKQIKLKRAHAWPTAGGKVESTQVRLEGSGTQQAKHVAVITYSYSVQGAAHTGLLRRGFMLHGSAHKWADAYVEGRNLLVRYNPNNAKDSVLLEHEQTGAQQVNGKGA